MKKSPNARQRVIDTTVELFQSQGYHATGLNQIVKESATPKGSLYFHFPGGKEELALEAIHASRAGYGCHIEQTLAQHEDLADAVEAYLLGVAQHLQQTQFSKTCPVAAVTLETEHTNETLRCACGEAFAAWRELFDRRFVQAGFSSQEARRWATTILSVSEGAMVLSRAQQDTRPLEDAALLLKDLIKTALRRR